MAKEYLVENHPKKMKKSRRFTNKKTITLINGSVMRCRAAGDTGDSGRGFEADILIVDEAARMSKYFWLAVRPIILMCAGEIWLASTPFGKQGYFWEMFNESYNLKLPEARFKVFYTTTEKVIKEREFSESWTEEQKSKALSILEVDKRTMSKLEYGQEYEGLFLEDLQQFFPDELIIKSQCVNRPDKIEPNRDYYLGQDIARMGEDQTTFCIGYLTTAKEPELIQVENLVTTKTYLTETYKSNKELDKKYNFKKILVDDEGIGIGVFDMMMDDEDLKRKTIGINNSKRVIDAEGKEKGIFKTDLYYWMRGLMEKGKIKLLKDDAIFQSLKSVQYEYSTDVKGNPVIKIHGNNTHIAEGLIRLAWAYKYKELNISVYSIKI
jgi:glutathione peroxidase-family protein